MNFDLKRRQFLAMSGWLSLEFFLTGCGGGSSGAQPSGSALESSTPEPGTPESDAPELGTAEPITPTSSDILRPEIVSHPADQTIKEGASAIFSVVAVGDSLTYQWQRNGIDISGATEATYATPPLAVQDSGGVYAVLVSNEAGAVQSNAAAITVSTAGITVDSTFVTVDAVSAINQ